MLNSPDKCRVELRQRQRRSGAVALLAVLVRLAAACDEGQPCTEIGCTDGLFVTVVDGSGAAVPAFGAVVTTASATYQASCDGATTTPVPGFEGIECLGEGQMQIPVTTAPVQVDVTAPEGSASQELTPGFVDVQPNGEGCPPTCTQAHETMELT